MKGHSLAAEPDASRFCRWTAQIHSRRGEPENGCHAHQENSNHQPHY